ncbi:ABC transporter family substrate-binding protein [Agrococcus sp. SGAir0287]|uniref:ABC transporter family substrate-binding protein n=1 Tax=Agrococcus sp. SGAir0287 TaxID=2070347 RepID=UPI0020C78623|nr:ABC transporter family substrate-binding protein [Agrococcus sp. SGAir0287]
MFNKQTRARGLMAVAAVGVAGLALSACTTSGDTPGASGSGGGESVTVAVTNALTSLNSATPDTNLNTNGMAEYISGSNGGLGTFYQLGSDYSIVHDETNVSYELVSDDPLTVQYSINDGAVWSDGEPITTTDLLLTWAITSGYYDDVTIDPESGEPTSGTQYFQLAGSTAGLDTTSYPEIDEDAGTMTITYSEPYVDWELAGMLSKPAHAMAEIAGVSLEDVQTALANETRGDPANPAEPDATLLALGEAWLTGYNITEMPTDENVVVGAGPYILSDFTADDGGSAVFSLNENWAGDAPAFDTVIMSFIGDTTAQVSALRNGEVDLIAPTSITADTTQALDEAGLEVDLGDALSYDHVDLSFDSPVFSNRDYREAFLLTIPRQQILDSIITPINPEAEVLNSQLFVSSQPQYADAVAANGYAENYGDVDIARAQELLAGATPEITILYNTANPNRVDTFQLIQQSAQQAGFIVNDGGSPDWSSLLGGGGYDVSIFGWISAGAGYAGLPQIWQTGGGGNYNAYSNPEVDSLVDQTQVIIDDTEAIDELQIQIDTLTQSDAYGLPLFQTPGLTAGNGRVGGVGDFFGGQTGIFYNVLDWTLED